MRFLRKAQSMGRWFQPLVSNDGRKVRTPQGRVTVNGRPPRGEEQGHRDERIQLR